MHFFSHRPLQVQFQKNEKYSLKGRTYGKCPQTPPKGDYASHKVLRPMFSCYLVLTLTFLQRIFWAVNIVNQKKKAGISSMSIFKNLEWWPFNILFTTFSLRNIDDRIDDIFCPLFDIHHSNTYLWRYLSFWWVENVPII